MAGLIYSVLTITLRANQNVTGLTLTIFGGGFANLFGGTLNKMAGGVGQISVALTSGAFRTNIPFLSDHLGAVGRIFFSYGFLAYLAVILAFVMSWFLNKTSVGLNLRAVGENPATADAAGISVSKYKYLATCIGAGISGLGGLYYTMDYIKGTWSTDGSIEKLGWLAVCTGHFRNMEAEAYNLGLLPVRRVVLAVLLHSGAYEKFSESLKCCRILLRCLCLLFPHSEGSVRISPRQSWHRIFS